jgi:hypothetical protein
MRYPQPTFLTGREKKYFFSLIYSTQKQERKCLLSVEVVKNIQAVSEIRVFILISGKTRKFMKPFSITFCKVHKSFN